MLMNSKRLTMSEHKGHEQHEIEDRDDVVDHISNLPDCILHHILSLIPTKEVVKTSILSTSWKNLWVSVPNIHIDDALLSCRESNARNPHKVTSFMNFVERVLRLRGALNIKELRLRCSGSSEESQIHSWISDTIIHNVQKLHLVVSRGVPSMIPWSILDRSSLVSLKIRTTYVSKLASCISFPCLKTLHMRSVLFPNDDRAEKLLLGCPILEELVLIGTWKNLKNIVISNSTLKSLTIGGYNDPTSGCNMKIDAPNLTFFGYFGFLSHEILLNNVSSLVKACIYILPHCKWQTRVNFRAINLLKRLQYVVSLRVSDTAIESLVSADNFPVFENLSHLTFTSAIQNYTFGELMDVLSLCPVLQSICFSEGLNCGLVENKSNWSCIPICMKKCLKRLTLEKFHGYNSEICFLQFVLKYACVLERMDMWWSL